MICYHAMPFHRYFFHVCRQILANNYESSPLTSALENKPLTKCSDSAITSHHSLAKNFLLCNGKTVNIENFPNIPTDNDSLVSSNTVDENKITYSNYNSWSDKSVYKALKNSSNLNGYIKLPNLFSIDEAYPRFIRGLQWDTSAYDDNPLIQSSTSYVKNLNEKDEAIYIHTNNEKVI
jgi:hypothetical protein